VDIFWLVPVAGTAARLLEWTAGHQSVAVNDFVSAWLDAGVSRETQDTVRSKRI